MIEIEELSKQYMLGNIGTGTLSMDMHQWIKGISRIYSGKSRRISNNSSIGQLRNNHVWSLKDINLGINEGDVLGVIGNNGAGKSTLLKIISKITKPTSGIVRLNGRVVSLLEVGTGFHPDLSGRENVFLNGAILGMTKSEIRKKFDEIVDFSGVEKYIDTPVKRYSSGMYVRLGFAIAAHLEPEILIVDEVLAVGDYTFQQKCLGKMQDVSRQGRTVLFVSHSMPAIKQLCNKALLLEKGRMSAFGPMDDVLVQYQREEAEPVAGIRVKLPDATAGYFVSWKLKGDELPGTHSCYSRDRCTIAFQFNALEFMQHCEVRFMIKYEKLVILHGTSMGKMNGFSVSPGTHTFRFSFEFPVRDAKLDVEMVFLTNGRIVDTWISQTKLTILDKFDSYVNAGMLNPDIIFTMDSTE